MILSARLMTNPTGERRFIPGSGWVRFGRNSEVIHENKFFIDPRMNDEELSVIMHSAKQCIRDLRNNFGFNTDDPTEEADLQKAIDNLMWKCTRILTEQLPSPNGQLRSVVDLFRDESQVEWPKYVFKADHEDVDVCVEIEVIEDMGDVRFSDADIINNIKLLGESVSDTECRRIYTSQLLSDILASHGHRCIGDHIWKMLEQCW